SRQRAQELSKRAQHDERDLVAAVEGHPFHPPARGGQIGLKRFGRLEREVVIRAAVAYERREAGARCKAGSPEVRSDAGAGELDERGEGARVVEGEVTGEHRTLRKAPEDERARAELAGDAVERGGERGARLVDAVGVELR